MPKTRKRKSLQETFVSLLDRRIPAENLPNRKWISVREALLRKVMEFAERGHPAAVAMITAHYARFDVVAEREEDQKAQDGAFEAACRKALERIGR